MQHMRTVVQQLPEKLGLQGFYEWLDSQGKDSRLGENARDTVARLLDSADEDYDNKIRHIVEDISVKVDSSSNSSSSSSSSSSSG